MKDFKREELAKRAEEAGVPALARALRDDNTNAICEEISRFGWIRISTGLPDFEDEVQVTDGKQVTIAWRKEPECFTGGANWETYPGNPFDLYKIIAWIYKPSPPFEDFYEV